MNTGAEAVESAVKVARKRAYDVKGVPADRATIVVAADNFHGRTTTIVSFSTDPTARTGFGPFTPGFRVVPYNGLAALEAAVDETTAAVLIEPVQGEAGVSIPDEGYLAGVRELTARAGCLFIADEIQSGLGRTGRALAVEHEEVLPDLVLLGKALGGGIVPVSAVVGRRDVLGVLRPGEHRSAFGGNPLAAAVGSAVVELLRTGEFQRRAAGLGTVLTDGLTALLGRGVVGFRARGLWAGVGIGPGFGTGRGISERLMAAMLKRRITFLAKAGYFTGPGIKGRLTAHFFRSAGQIPVDRSGKDAGQAAIREGLGVLSKDELLGIYPEGTRSHDGRLYKGKVGVAVMALKAGVPVIPCAMIGTFEAQPPGKVIPNIHPVVIRFGKPLGFSRYAGMENERAILRAVTDEIMYAILSLSEQEYVDEYAAVVKAQQAEENAAEEAWLAGRQA